MDKGERGVPRPHTVGYIVYDVVEKKRLVVEVESLASSSKKI